MNNWETIIYDKIDNVARITMNRPEVRNARDGKMTYELDAAFSEAADDDEIKVIVLAGAGPHFSSGHDLRATQPGPEHEPALTAPGVQSKFNWMYKMDIDMFLRWRDIPKPTIAQVQGVCIAAGTMLVAVCDLVIASDDARFADPSVRAGSSGVEYFFHPWELGPRKAKEFLFTGDFIDAQEAWRLGFVNRVVPREKLEEETLALARRIALMPGFGLQLAKASVNETLDIEGYRNSILNAFKAQRLAHSHMVEISGSSNMSGVNMSEGQSAKDWAKGRDRAFRREP